jgi:hypothetical protein
MDESYEDPRYGSSQGKYVTRNADAGGEFVPLSVAAPLGRYVGSGDSGDTYQEYTEQERAALAAQMEAARQARLDQASAYLAVNPLGLSGDQISTRFGERDVSLFRPIASDGQPITGSTPTQLIDPDSNMPVFLSDPNDPTSYTYDNTGTPAIGGTLEQQAAIYRPIENKGVFGTLGGDLLSAVKDPYFHKFLAATAAIAGGGMALNSAYGVGGLGTTGATSIPVNLGSTITTSGGGLPLGSSTAGGFLGGPGEILAGAAGTGGGSLGAPSLFSGLGNLVGSVTPAQAFQAARLALPVVGALTGASGAGGTGQGGQGGQTGGQGGGQGGGQPTTVMSSQGPWNTFLNPTLTRQEVTNQSPVEVIPQLAMLENGFEPSLANQLAQSGAIPSNLAGSNVPSANYYNYGTPPQNDFFGQSYFSPLMAAKGGKIKKPQKLAMGGLPVSDEAEPHIPEFITGATGHYVKGRGDGQSDDIKAMLADGEYVFDADTVAQLGNGSSDAGAKFLDNFREAIREHKRSAPVDKIPPKASPLQYVKAAMKRT